MKNYREISPNFYFDLPVQIIISATLVSAKLSNEILVRRSLLPILPISQRSTAQSAFNVQNESMEYTLDRNFS